MSAEKSVPPKSFGGPAIQRDKLRQAGRQNEKSKEYFSVVWRARRAITGVPARQSFSVGGASLLGVLLKKSSNINQKTPPSPVAHQR